MEKVIAEIPPELKRQFYAHLKLKDMTYRNWLISKINEELSNGK